MADAAPNTPLLPDSPGRRPLPSPSSSSSSSACTIVVRAVWAAVVVGLLLLLVHAGGFREQPASSALSALVRRLSVSIGGSSSTPTVYYWSYALTASSPAFEVCAAGLLTIAPSPLPGIRTSGPAFLVTAINGSRWFTNASTVVVQPIVALAPVGLNGAKNALRLSEQPHIDVSGLSYLVEGAALGLLQTSYVHVFNRSGLGVEDQWGALAVVVAAPFTISATAPSTPPCSGGSATSGSLFPFSVASHSSHRLNAASMLSVGLVHHYPLRGDFLDHSTAPGNAPAVLQGSPACSSLSSSMWTQHCTANRNPATLVAPDSLALTASSDMSQCAYMYLPSRPNATVSLFSCNGASLGGDDCLEVYYLKRGLLIARINGRGNAQGEFLSLPVASWFHLCVVYQASSSTLALYLNAHLFSNFGVSRSTNRTGIAVLGGGGAENPSQPALASFSNWRLYSVALNYTHIDVLYNNDGPPSPYSFPADSTVVFILAGQSNMVGDNWDSPTPPGAEGPYTLPQITQLGRYTSGGYSASGNDDRLVVRAADPLEFDNSDWLGPYTNVHKVSPGAGPGMSFAHSFVLGTGYNVTLVPCAVVSSTFTRWGNGGDFFKDCVNRTNFLLGKPGYVLGGALWSQGEANSDGLTSTIQYTEYAQSMVAAFRAQLLGGSAMPFVAMQLRPAWVARVIAEADQPGAEAVQAAITALPFSVPRASVVYGLDERGLSLSPGLGDVHYSAAAQRYLGTVMYTAWHAALYNVPGRWQPGPIVQLFAQPVDSRQQMQLWWTPDPIALEYILNVTVTEPSGLGITHVLTLTGSSFTTTAFLDPSVSYAAVVRAVGPTGLLGAPSPIIRFSGVHPYWYYRSGYPASAVQPIAWLVADSVATFQSDGSGVTVWEDVSGHNNSLTQHNVQRLPDLHTGLDHGHAALAFVNGWLETPALAVPTALTFVFALSVWWNDSDPHHHSAFFGTSLFSLFINNSGHLPDWKEPADSRLPRVHLGLTPSLAPSIVSVGWRMVNATHSEAAYHVNGRAVGSDHGRVGVREALVIKLGAYEDSQSRDPATGYVSELMLFASKLSDTDRYGVEAHLSAKYGVATQPPPPPGFSQAAWAQGGLTAAPEAPPAATPWLALVSAVSSSASPV